MKESKEGKIAGPDGVIPSLEITTSDGKKSMTLKNVKLSEMFSSTMIVDTKILEGIGAIPVGKVDANIVIGEEYFEEELTKYTGVVLYFQDDTGVRYRKLLNAIGKEGFEPIIGIKGMGFCNIKCIDESYYIGPMIIRWLRHNGQNTVRWGSQY
eukprot:TRINITY_DN26753_c0_g3_i1.p3 TRINITY_DN26753_c0_g3~~TRINITY_DN26753_c0_g3_i1.p3  ORF type:complete len:154 (+),score=9.98 TRINITY_DN26753_c0_g3_i1:630-1091(+)